MTDVPPPSIPPSIPPRQRPTSGAGTRTVTTVRGRGADGSNGQQHEHDEASAPRVPVSRAAAAPVRPPFPTVEPPRASSSRPAPESPRSASSSTRPVGPPDDEEPEGPSPLAVAVDRTGVWLRKAADVTGTTLSAAYASLTRPRPKDDPMTANPEAPTAPPRPNTAPAGIAGAGPAVRTTSGRVPTVSGGPRRVRLAISRVDPWSVMKLAFLLAFAAGIMLVVAVSVLWLTLNELHVFTSINDLVQQIVGTESPIDVLSYVRYDKVLSVSTLVAVLDVFLLTALATIGAFLYNVVAALVGGVHVTMTDE